MGHPTQRVRHTVRRRASALPLTLAAALLIAACSPTPPADPVDEPDPADQPPDPPATSEPDPDPDVGSEQPDEDELDEVWAAFHEAWNDQAAADQPDPQAFADIAVDPDAVVDTLIAQRGDSRLVSTDAELWPRFDIGGERAQIADCVIVTQHPEGQPDSLATISIGWEATAIAEEDGWRIEQARPLELFCIAEELNDQLIEAYRAYRRAKDAAWDPPDPDHPDLERAMAGEQLEFIRDLLAEHQREGIVVRDPAPTDNAVVFDLGIGKATVSDCTVQVSGRGAFDLDTGERLDEVIQPIRDGQLDLQSVDLQRGEDGTWRVVDQAGTRDTNCVSRSTRYVVS